MRVAVASVALSFILAGAAAASNPMLDLMKRDVDPAANAFWAAGNDPPEAETAEAANARWDAAADGAAKMERYGRLLMSAEHTRPGEWNAFAALMAQAGATGRAAVEKRDMEAAFEAGGQLYEACSGCHAKYIQGRS